MRRMQSGSTQNDNIHKISKPVQTVIRIFCGLPLQEISMPFEKLPSSGKWYRTSRAALFLTSTAMVLLPPGAALASQGPGGGPGTAGPFTQLAMAILVYGTSVLIIGSGLIGALRKH